MLILPSLALGSVKEMNEVLYNVFQDVGRWWGNEPITRQLRQYVNEENQAGLAGQVHHPLLLPFSWPGSPASQSANF